jgi:hypothetical protein
VEAVPTNGYTISDNGFIGGRLSVTYINEKGQNNNDE